MINCHLLVSCCEHLWRGLKDLNLRASAEANGLANHRIKPLCQIPIMASGVRIELTHMRFKASRLTTWRPAHGEIIKTHG